ncbi:NAD-dependent epimerase/dehydratase family protein [Nocardia sp. NPDC047038]|uniref:NAD-dependent epimerase/dehydratase family protein n=1 Tax=Nocardia sp. NPDC047038 TaxID=3154338 RepID=UPI0033D48C6F
MLVTGAAGLIGVQVVRLLRDRGVRVVAVDDGSAGTLDRLDEFSTSPDVRVHVIDIRDAEALTDVFSDEHPWAVIHLAARHFIPACEADPAGTLDVNVMGTQRLIDVCVAFPPARVLFASTADVYAPSPRPHREDDHLAPAGVYGSSKLLCEELLRDQHDKLPGCVVTVARLFNVVGPGDVHPHLLPEIVRQLRRGPLLRLGDLETARDYVFVGDVAHALLAILDSGAGGVFNVGTGTATSGRDLVRSVAAVVGIHPDVRLDPTRLRRHHRPMLCADVARLRQLIPQWPMTSLEHSVAHAVRAMAGPCAATTAMR